MGSIPIAPRLVRRRVGPPIAWGIVWAISSACSPAPAASTGTGAPDGADAGGSSGLGSPSDSGGVVDAGGSAPGDGSTADSGTGGVPEPSDGAGSGGLLESGAGPAEAGVMDGFAEVDAPRGDAGSGSDDAGLGGPSRCASRAYAVCEDFEATAAGATPTGWTLPSTNYGTATVGVATDLAARGTHSWKVSVPTSPSSIEKYLQRANLGALANAHYGRLFFRILGPTTTAFVHWDLVLGAGQLSAGGARRVRWGSTGTGVGTQNSNWAWIYNVEQGDFGTEARTVHPRLNQWMCVEWQWDGTNQQARFYFDGVEALALHVDKTLPSGQLPNIPIFSTMNFGIAKYQSTDQPLVFWIDEIALDGQRIGCDG